MGSKLYVANLNYNSTPDDITEVFAEVGEVQEVQLITDRDTGRSRGFAFVTMGSSADAEAAIETLNGVDFQGRPLVVKEALPREGRGGGGGGGRSSGGGGNAGRGGGGGGRSSGRGGGGWSGDDWGDDWGGGGKPGGKGKKKGKPKGGGGGGRRKGGSWSEWEEPGW